MAKLHHFALDPFSRRIRLALAEKGEMVDLVEEKPWAPSARLIDLNPAGFPPVYIDDSGHSVAGAEALGEFIEERTPAKSLLLGNAYARAESRRLTAWFDVKFNAEVTEPVLNEKVVKRNLKGSGPATAPDIGRVRVALLRLKPHLDYLALLAEERAWLAGPHLSMADLAAAAHLSVLDYLGDVNWNEQPVAKAWYQRIKSRPAFRSLLADQLPGMPPAAHYADLDF